MRFNAARTVSSFMSTLLGQLGTRGVRLGRIAGIPVTLDWTWFPIAFLLVFGISSSLAEALGTVAAIVTAIGRIEQRCQVFGYASNDVLLQVSHTHGHMFNWSSGDSRRY